jgi:hypothetical protein
MAKEFSIDLHVLSFAIAISLMAAILFGLVPALQIVRHSPAEGLKEDSRSLTGGREREFGNVTLIGGRQSGLAVARSRRLLLYSRKAVENGTEKRIELVPKSSQP